MRLPNDLKDLGSFQILTEEQAGIAIGIIVAVLLILDVLHCFK